MINIEIFIMGICAISNTYPEQKEEIPKTNPGNATMLKFRSRSDFSLGKILEATIVRDAFVAFVREGIYLSLYIYYNFLYFHKYFDK